MEAVSEHILDNGLKVIVSEAHAAPTACCSIWYRAGSKHETVGATGLAHLLEHMMFKGTERFPKGEFDRILHRSGAIHNASTWLDRTNYYELIGAGRLATALELEADRMRGALFNERDLEDEMPVVRNELERAEDDPFTNLFERIQSLVFIEHPYHWPTIGWKSDVEAVRADQIRDFYHRFYVPGNAFLVIVGDVETSHALRLVERHFGRIPPGRQPPRVVTVEPPQKGERRVDIRKPGENDLVGMAYRVPQRRHPDNYALDLLGQILGHGRTSRLYRSLVERKLAVSTSAANFATLEDPFLFFVEAEVAPDVDPATVEEVVQETIHALQEHPVEPQELERAKKRNRVAFVYRRDRVSGQAFFLGELEVSCGWRFGMAYLDEMEKVSLDDIQRVSRTYLVPEARTVGRYLAIREAARAPLVLPQSIEREQAGETGPVEEPRPSVVQEMAGEPAAVRRAGAPARSPGPGSGAGAPGRTRTAPRVLREALPNGTVVLARANHANPTIEIAGRIEGGMLLEGDRHGLAHAVETMLDRGTWRHSRREIAEILEGLGAAISFRSTIEVLGFHAKCLREDLETVLALLAEMLEAPSFPAAEWEIVRAQIQKEIREWRQDTFERAYDRAMQLLCGAGHPYGRVPLGTEEGLAATTPDDLHELHRRSVAGLRTAVAVVGDLPPEAAVEIAGRHLGRIPAGEGFDARELCRRWTRIPDPGSRVYEHVELAEKAQVDLVFARPGISRVDPAYEPALVANYVFGGHFSSRINKQLRDNEGLTYGAYSRLRPGLGIVPWYASIGVHPTNLERAREGVLHEMARLRAGGVEGEEFEDAILHLTGSFPVRLESNRAVADMLLDAERYGLGTDVIETYVSRLEGIRREEVEVQAARLLDPGSVIIASAGTLAAQPRPPA